MKRILPIFATALLAGISAYGEVFVNETFPYTPGSLSGQGPWVVNGTAGSCPIEVVEESLSYADYQDEPSGNALRISMDTGKNALQCVAAPAGSPALTGTIYYSAIVRVDEFPSSLGKPGAIMSLTGANAYDGSFGDAITSTEGAGLYIKKGSSDSKALFGVSRKCSPNGVNAADVVWSPVEVNVGEIALIVIGYDAAPGAEKAMLWVNSVEPASTPDATDSSADVTLSDVRGLQIAQRSALTSKIPQVTVDDIRMADNLEELIDGNTAPVVIPNVTFSVNPLDFGQVHCNVTVNRTVVIKATDLQDDITITPAETGEGAQASLSALSIPKDLAMAEEGYELTVTLTPVESRFFSNSFTFSTPGMSDKQLRVEWRPVPTLVATTLSQLANEDSNDMTSVYVYKGEATVTFVESYYDLSYDRVVNSIFAQDATGGVELRSATGCGYQEIDITGVQVGDNLTDITGYLIFGDSGLTMIPRTESAWTVVSHDNEVVPIDLTLRELAMAENGYIYGNQLVRVSNVRFPIKYYEAGDYHGLWNSQKYEIYDGTLDEYEGLAWMWCNKGADYFKQSTEGYFDHIWTLTGILNNYYPLHISPRGYADFECEGLNPEASVDEISVSEEGLEAFDINGVPVDMRSAKGIVIIRSNDGKVSKRFNR